MVESSYVKDQRSKLQQLREQQKLKLNAIRGGSGGSGSNHASSSNAAAQSTDTSNNTSNNMSRIEAHRQRLQLLTIGTNIPQASDSIEHAKEEQRQRLNQLRSEPSIANLTSSNHNKMNAHPASMKKMAKSMYKGFKKQLNFASTHHEENDGIGSDHENDPYLVKPLHEQEPLYLEEPLIQRHVAQRSFRYLPSDSPQSALEGESESGRSAMLLRQGRMQSHRLLPSHDEEDADHDVKSTTSTISSKSTRDSSVRHLISNVFAKPNANDSDIVEAAANREMTSTKVQDMSGDEDNYVDDEDPMYRAFLQDLKRELQADHKELFKGYQTVLDMPAIKMCSEDQDESEQSNKHRLQPESRITLSQIHKHLMNEPSSITESLISQKPQLLNDKNHYKLRQKQLHSQSSSQVSTVSNTSATTTASTDHNKYISSQFTGGNAHSSLSTIGINAQQRHHTDNINLAQNSAMKAQAANNPLPNNLPVSRPPRKTPAADIATPAYSPMLPPFLNTVKLNPGETTPTAMQPLYSRQTLRKAPPPLSRKLTGLHSKHDPGRGSSSIVDLDEALDDSIGDDQIHPQKHDETPVKRNTTKEKEKVNLVSSNSDFDGYTTDQTPAWMKRIKEQQRASKLASSAKVMKQIDLVKPQTTIAKTQTHSLTEHPTSPKSIPQTTSSTVENQSKPIIPLPPCEIKVGTIVSSEKDLCRVCGDDSPSMIIWLAPEENVKRALVVGGNDNIVIVVETISAAGWTGQVEWSCHRKAVHSLTLSATATGAELILVDGSSKRVCFPSPVQCLQFAQCFYSVPSSFVERMPSTLKDASSLNSRAASPPRTLRPNPQSPSDDKKEHQNTGDSLEPALGNYNSDTGEKMQGSDGYAYSFKPQNDARSAMLAVINNRQVANDVTDDERSKSSPRELIMAEINKTRQETEEAAANVQVVLDSSLMVPVKKQGESEKEELEYDPRTILMQALKRRKDSDKNEEPPGNPRAAMMAAIKKRQIAENEIDRPLINNSPMIKADEEQSGSGSLVTIEDSLSEEDEILVKKFKSMLKMGVPEAAVRHKMASEGISLAVTLAVFKDPEKSKDSDDSMPTTLKPEISVMHETQEETTSPQSTLSFEEETVANKYRKMLKMHIPQQAVRHKMTMDQIDSKIVEAVLGPDPNAKKSVIAERIQLSPEQEKEATKYIKMLKMSIPKEAVRHKMMRDQVSEIIVKAVLGQDDGDSPTTPERPNNRGRGVLTTGAKKKIRDLVQLHWTPLSPTTLSNSIWEKMNINSVQPNKSSAALPDDIVELEKLFQKKKITKGPPAGPSAEGDGKQSQQLARLIDLTRANNISIGLKAFKEFTLEEFSEILGDVDPEEKIVGERLQFIKALLPQQQELTAVKRYSGDENMLVPAEMFFKHLLKIKRLESKVITMQTMGTFMEIATELRSKFILLRKVCDQVVKSECLVRVLETVLQIGNIMNEGTRTGGAAGFKFESLLKLTQTKSTDGKMTVLDYLVRTFMAKAERHVLDLAAEFPEVQDASKLLVNDMLNEVRSLKANLENAEKELEAMKIDQEPKLINHPSRGFVSTKGGSDPKAGIFAAIKARKSDEDSSENEGVKGRNASKSDGYNIESSSQPSLGKNVEYSPGVRRLELFIYKGKYKYDKIRIVEEEAIESCRVSYQLISN